MGINESCDSHFLDCQNKLPSWQKTNLKFDKFITMISSVFVSSDGISLEISKMQK